MPASTAFKQELTKQIREYAIEHGTGKYVISFDGNHTGVIEYKSDGMLEEQAIIDIPEADTIGVVSIYVEDSSPQKLMVSNFSGITPITFSSQGRLVIRAGTTGHRVVIN